MDTLQAAIQLNLTPVKLVIQFSTQLENRWRQNKNKNTRTVEGMWTEIKNTYVETAQQVLGQVKGRKKKPWITREILELSDRRRDIRKTRQDNKENMERY